MGSAVAASSGAARGRACDGRRFDFCLTTGTGSAAAGGSPVRIAFAREDSFVVLFTAALATLLRRLRQTPPAMSVVRRRFFASPFLCARSETGDISKDAPQSEAHLREALEVFDFRLSDEEMRALDAYASEPAESYSFTCDCKATGTCGEHGGGVASPFA